MNIAATKIIEKIAKQRGSTFTRIVGRQRTQHLVEIRAECMRTIQIYTDLSLAEIGQIFDNRDRTTVQRLLNHGIQ